MRVLLDTNVLVRATGKASSPARELFLRLLDPPHTLVASTFLVDEVRRVLNYPRVRSIHGLAPDQVDEYVRDLRSATEMIDMPTPLAFHVTHDPDDDPIIATSVLGRVDVLCTLDKHLRRSDVIDYCAQFQIRVLTDVELLAEIRGRN